MGIRGLQTFLRKRCYNTIQITKLEDWRGKRIGIDILCLLYRSRAANIPLLESMSSFLAECRKNGITPIVVFDGSPPAQKQEITAKRKQAREESEQLCSALEDALSSSDLSEEQKTLIQRKIEISRKGNPQIKSEDRNVVKELFYATGTQFVHAIGEADCLLTYLFTTGAIDAVISTDFDFLGRGVNHLLVPSSHDIRGSIILEHFCLPLIQKSLGFSQDQFIDFVSLFANDYYPGIGHNTGIYGQHHLFKLFKLAGNSQNLVRQLRLKNDVIEKIVASRRELMLEGKGLDDFLKPEQKERLLRTENPIEEAWIRQKIETGELVKETLVFLQ